MGRPKGAPNDPIRMAARQEAREAGKTLYYSGSPCRHGHDCERYVSSGICVECDRERYHKRKGARIISMAEWRKNNVSVYRAACKNWRAKNPEKVKENRYKRKRRKANGPGFTLSEVLRVLAKQGGKCVNCFVALSDNFHADHIMPLALGGEHDIANIQVLCAPCNQRKHKKDPFVWAQQNGRLL